MNGVWPRTTQHSLASTTTTQFININLFSTVGIIWPQPQPMPSSPRQKYIWWPLFTHIHHILPHVLWSKLRGSSLPPTTTTLCLTHITLLDSPSSNATLIPPIPGGSPPVALCQYRRYKHLSPSSDHSQIPSIRQSYRCQWCISPEPLRCTLLYP